MPQLQPSRALRAAKCLSNTSSLATSRIVPTATRSFSSTQPVKAADHAHEDHYDPPTGWLFGVKPGEKAEKEGWENVWVYGFFGSLALGVVGYAFKPDTSIQTWALEEARRRLEVEGILKEPESKS
ncbi:ESSS subunit of NADH:ubiquinone oxidoreductase-domain-containing protein [Rhexocercosporidium sp. MPI-PUGE-AT-0058]|nr:ESSS subunit of NADH:ubiquinone oxidoreductase-domain-containing protein [Rhexocercosporidium sp. MPI-PUGE-AT-0058]